VWNSGIYSIDYGTGRVYTRIKKVFFPKKIREREREKGI